MIRYKTTITTITIIAQIDKLVKNCFNFKLVFDMRGFLPEEKPVGIKLIPDK